MVDIDLSQPPFSLLDEAGRARVRSGVDLAYYDTGEVILEAGQAGDHVFVIHKGEVAELDTGQPGEQARIGHYTTGDLFGAISILNGQSRYRFIAEQESLCYLLPRQLFEQLCEAHPAFADYFRQSLAAKTRLLAERRSAGGATLAGFMLARVADCQRSPRVVAGETSIGEAAARLRDTRADSLLVAVDDRFGMLTKTDLLDALVARGLPREHPVAELAHVELVTARADDYLFQALVSMTRHGIERVVVIGDDGQPAGVVEMTDVLSFFSSRSHMVSLELEQAEDLEALAQASARLPSLVQTLMAQGVKLRFAMELLAALNGRIIDKAFEFLVAPAQREACCLLVLGSEGRGEQILKTDQDNALILADDGDWAERGEQMTRFTETLLELGYPRCPGNIMVSNPQWVNTVSGWCQRIHHWADEGDGPALMNLAILLDAHAVAGDPRLLEPVRETLFARCSHDQMLLAHFARAALSFSTPLTLFGSLKRPQHGIDIKKGGIFPIVHGARALALEHRLRPTSTLARLEALADEGHLEARFAEDLGEALTLFAELRLTQQLARLDEPPGALDSANRVVVQRLSSLERDLLREALHLVKEFKQRLTQRFHLEY
ncbi:MULTISPECIES: putative nucleotidyltransferase substrate binding domain-containing protein [unclassified Modicisalibacter]|uniref:putative nucleotidyltransferase substrate binding domain-containing protein n=1 Tax=unclassified Modicisalibacter TaxID=2679913 RepID=UPI001CC99532|nr:MULTISPECIES: putative nucleotidyltransferase substrate binding domain-containing protein [unclassified Modicisalibacter]MBZ9559270.1 cyclic nucleotide-binding/CBS domain-containing protein [Modicisalibacter sp. R2A 31.J]MBZ9576565.1 cyclic nucleotide-binding/CBS domain-containing protein [Modicisalibacter sp. MOD 31.J]